MPIWTPTEDWKGQDVFIIGGGKSLEHFDWNLLRNELTIGCNDAYQHGSDICKLCVFGDGKWWAAHEEKLKKYHGVVFTNIGILRNSKIPWLWWMPRGSSGLYRDCLGWSSTGNIAVNLAVLLGAKRIFLLGFDMHLTKGRANWHTNTLDKPISEVYGKFISGFAKIKKDLESKFPGTEIVNITDNSSLNMFSKIGVEEFWKGRK